MARSNVIEVAGEFADGISAPLKDLGATVSGLGRLFSPAALAGGTLAAAFAALVQNADEALESDIKLDGAIKRLGASAGVTSEQVKELAGAIQQTSKFTDESVKAAAGSLLLFDKVVGDTFTRALSVSADLAAVMGQDIPSAAQSLGRALQDPERGLRQLRRAGIAFTEDQIALLKVMGDTGRQAEAQAVILAELEKRTKGAAQETQQSLGGAMVSLKNNFMDLLEGGGKDGPLPRVVGWLNALNRALAKTARGPGDELERLQTALERYENSSKPFEIAQAERLRGLIKLERERLRVQGEAASAPEVLKPDLSEFDINANVLANSTLPDNVSASIDAGIKAIEDRKAKIQKDLEDAIARGDTEEQKRFQAEIDMLQSKYKMQQDAAQQNVDALEEILGTMPEIMEENLVEIVDPVAEFTDNIKAAFEGMVRTGQFSARRLVQFLIAELARKELFKAIDALGDALGNALRGGGTGKTAAVLKAAGAFFGFAAGGGSASGPRIVGEEGPELLLGGGRVMNRRQLAFAAGNGGGNITYAPQSVFNVNGDPNPQLLAALNDEWERKRRADQVGFLDMLERNGLGRMR